MTDEEEGNWLRAAQDAPDLTDVEPGEDAAETVREAFNAHVDGVQVAEEPGEEAGRADAVTEWDEERFESRRDAFDTGLEEGLAGMVGLEGKRTDEDISAARDDLMRDVNLVAMRNENDPVVSEVTQKVQDLESELSPSNGLNDKFQNEVDELEQRGALGRAESEETGNYLGG